MKEIIKRTIIGLQKSAVTILNRSIADKIARLKDAEKIGGIRSIAYHESGHTAMSYIFRPGATQRYQAVSPHGTNLGMSGVKPQQEESLKVDESMGILLGGFAAQRLLEKDPRNNPKHGTIVMEYGIEHEIRFQQSDIFRALMIIQLLKTKNLTKNKKKEIIEKLVSILTQFFRDNPKLLKFIVRLAYLNQKKSTLDKKDIDSAADYAQIGPLDVAELANRFHSLNFTKIIQEA